MTHLNFHGGTFQTFCPKVQFLCFLNILSGSLNVGDLNFTVYFKILFRKPFFVKFLAKTLKLTKDIWSWMSMNCVIGKTIWELRTVRHPFYLNRHPNRISMIGTRIGSSILLNKTLFLRVDNGPIRWSDNKPYPTFGSDDGPLRLRTITWTLCSRYIHSKPRSDPNRWKINFIIIMKWTNDH